MKRSTIIALALGVLLFPSALFSEEATAEKTPAINWEEIDASEFAAKLAAATAAGDSWATDPETIMVTYAGSFISADGEKRGQSRTLRMVSRGDEIPKGLNVVLVDDGLFDDSIKTSLCRLQLSRTAEGTWKLRKAYRSQVKWPKP